MKIVEYITVTHTDQKLFVEGVQNAILDGYVPQGGVSITTSSTQLIQMQAMVKYGE